MCNCNDNLKCKHCNSNRLNNKMGIIGGKQRYLCRDCRKEPLEKVKIIE